MAVEQFVLSRVYYAPLAGNLRLFIQGSASMLPTEISSPTGSATSLSDLKAEFDKLSTEVARIGAERARRAADLAQRGVDGTRGTIEDYPMTAIAGAFAAGALLGLALMPARSSQGWSASGIRQDLSGYADDLRRKIRNAARETSMADNLERLASTLSATDAKATIGPAVERLWDWFTQARNAAKDAVAKVV